MRKDTDDDHMSDEKKSAYVNLVDKLEEYLSVTEPETSEESGQGEGLFFMNIRRLGEFQLESDSVHEDDIVRDTVKKPDVIKFDYSALPGDMDKTPEEDDQLGSDIKPQTC